MEQNARASFLLPKKTGIKPYVASQPDISSSMDESGNPLRQAAGFEHYAATKFNQQAAKQKEKHASLPELDES